MEHLSWRSICSAVRLMELLSTKCIASKRSPTSTPIARAAWDRGGGGGWWRTYEGSLVATSAACSTKKWQGVKRWAGLLLLFTCTFCQIQISTTFPSASCSAALTFYFSYVWLHICRTCHLYPLEGVLLVVLYWMFFFFCSPQVREAPFWIVVRVY